ncbi:MAG: signal peptidase I [Fervidicoccaceae archaeon]
MRRSGGPATRLVKIAIFAIVALLALFSIHSALEGRALVAVVSGSSMLPLLRSGDLVFVEAKKSHEIKVGDIIVYRSVRGHLIIHRVIGVVDAGTGVEFVTKGDSNPFDDSFLGEYRVGRGVPYERVVGVVWSPLGIPFKLPYVGVLGLLLRAAN